MATTTYYGFTVPTSADLVRNGATAISTLGTNLDDFISGSSASGKLFYLAASSTNSTSRTTTSTTWANTATVHSVTFTPGKSQFFAVIWRASMSNSATGNRMECGVNITGGLTSSPDLYNCVQLEGTTRVAGTHVQFFDAGAASASPASITVTLQFQTTAGTLTCFDSNIQVVCFG